LTCKASFCRHEVLLTLLIVLLIVPAAAKTVKRRRVDCSDTVTIPDTLVSSGTVTAEPLGTYRVATIGTGRVTTAPSSLDTDGHPRVKLVTIWTATGVAADSVRTLGAPTGVVRPGTLVLVHTLIKIKMELETLWTATLIRPHTVLTSFITPRVIVTLIGVNTESPRLV